MLGSEQREYLAQLAGRLSKVAWEGKVIQDTVYGLAKEMDVRASDAFGSVYISVLGRRRGPRLGFFLASMDRNWVLARLEEAAS
jgi:lysyl-tRNA synthetase class 1